MPSTTRWHNRGLRTEARPAPHTMICMTTLPDRTASVTSVRLCCRDPLLELILKLIHQHQPACGMEMKQLVRADALLQGDQGVIIMLCGTAGTGKSTLASLLGQRLGITTILSTDSIRHMLRYCLTHPSHRATPNQASHRPHSTLQRGSLCRAAVCQMCLDVRACAASSMRAPGVPRRSVLL